MLGKSLKRLARLGNIGCYLHPGIMINRRFAYVSRKAKVACRRILLSMNSAAGSGGESERKEAHERISAKAADAASAVLDLITSIGVTIEQRIGLEDQIKNISKEADSMLDRVDDLTKANQKKILLAYKNFLQRNIEAVDQRLKEMD